MKSSTKRTTTGRDCKMTMRAIVKTALGSAILAVAVYVILALPGFLSDTASIVPLAQHQDQRP
jgi:hypothetical protein